MISMKGYETRYLLIHVCCMGSYSKHLSTYLEFFTYWKVLVGHILECQKGSVMGLKICFVDS